MDPRSCLVVGPRSVLQSHALYAAHMDYANCFIGPPLAGISLLGCLLVGCSDAPPEPPTPPAPMTATDPATTNPVAEASDPSHKQRPSAVTDALPTADAQYIHRYLPGVVIGPAPSTPPLTDAESWLPLTVSTRTYLTPGIPPTTLVHTMSRTDRAPGMPVGSTQGGWAMRLPDETVQYLRGTQGQNIVLPTVVSTKAGLITRLNPPETLVLEGGIEGKPVTSTITVRVYDLHEPSVLAHSGSYKSTWEDLGGWTVKVPMGTFDSRLIRLHAVGTIGPAAIDVRRYYFLAKGIGIVAYATEFDIAAFLVYHDDQRRSGVLKSIDPISEH
jgi:hypothetical protein